MIPSVSSVARSHMHRVVVSIVHSPVLVLREKHLGLNDALR